MWAMLHIQLSPESFIHGSFFEGRVSLITLILMAPFQILPFKDSRIHRLHNCSHQSVKENGCETCELVLKALLLSNKQTPIIPNHIQLRFFLIFLNFYLIFETICLNHQLIYQIAKSFLFHSHKRLFFWLRLNEFFTDGNNFQLKYAL